MKKSLCLLFVGIPMLVSAQSLTQSPGTAATIPSPACLSCAGSIWNNETNVSAADGLPADIDLMQNPTCFQSTCFYSRTLASSNFGFSIPGTATILGIQVDILRKAPAINTVVDTIVQLRKGGVTTGNNY